MSLSENLKKAIGYGGALIMLLAIASGIGLSIGFYNKENREGIEKKVKQGYVIPNKLEAPLYKDLDKDGKYEVLMNYKGKPYLLIEDEQGAPIIKKYTLVERASEKMPPKIIIEE